MCNGQCVWCVGGLTVFFFRASAPGNQPVDFTALDVTRAQDTGIARPHGTLQGPAMILTVFSLGGLEGIQGLDST